LVCCAAHLARWFAGVRACPSLCVCVVTQLDTHSSGPRQREPERTFLALPCRSMCTA
jgi:hypothetical protein